MPYLVRDKPVKMKAHIWDEEAQDTLCAMWSTGGISQTNFYHVSETPEGRNLCFMCVKARINRDKTMKDQHTYIKGYRYLSQFEIDLMNRIKLHAEGTRLLIDEVSKVRNSLQAELAPPLDQDQISESQRCLALAKTNLQQGFMWFVRAVALPESF